MSDNLSGAIKSDRSGPLRTDLSLYIKVGLMTSFIIIVFSVFEGHSSVALFLRVGSSVTNFPTLQTVQTRIFMIFLESILNSPRTPQELSP